MMYANIKYNDIADGEGVRTTLFVSGCDKRCKGCQNPEAWDFNYGKHLDDKVIIELLNSINKPWIQGLTICGGEPLHPANRMKTHFLAESVKYVFDGTKDVWCYTGYNFEDIPRIYLEYIDVLVDGEYIENLRDPSLWFKGSSNQRIIDVQESLKKGKVVLWKSN